MHKIILLILVIIGYIPNGSAATNSKKNDSPHYSLIIDAGSSGSRIYIYKVQPNTKGELPEITLVGEKKVVPGISKFEQYPDSILLLMETLLTYADSKIDSKNWKETELHLMATAGMRLLEKSQQENTLEELSSFFKKNSEFNFKNAVIISGQYEALYGWSSLNYLDDHFDPSKPRKSMMEMGGASTQITFLSEKSKGKDVLCRNYAGKEYDVFAKSYLNMGQDRAQELVSFPACYPKEYGMTDGQEGTGGFMECSQEIQRVFNEICDSLGIDDSLFKSNLQVNTEDEFVAIAAFYYTFEFLKLEDSLTLDVLRATGIDFCDKNWEDIYDKYKEEYKNLDIDIQNMKLGNLKSYCFNASYFWTLLGQEYGFDNNLVIKTKIEIDSQDITWTIGAVLDLEMGHKPEAHK